MTSPNDKLAGVYRLNSTIFPVPITNWPDEQVIAGGMNGIPILSSYKQHTWSWSQLESEYAELLFSLFQTQQDNNSALETLETDPYDATGANADYGTSIYSDFTILSVGSRTRGMPTYDDVTVTFEVYVA